MREFTGKIMMKVKDQPNYPNPEAAAFDAEVYLNGDVASEVFKRYGVSIRVHIQGGTGSWSEEEASKG